MAAHTERFAREIGKAVPGLREVERPRQRDASPDPIAGAQKLSLAGQIGTLSLALRKAGDSEPVDSRPITLADLFNSKSEEQDSTRFATISVMRSQTKTIYSVPRTGVPSFASTARAGGKGGGIAEAGLKHGPE